MTAPVSPSTGPVPATTHSAPTVDWGPLAVAPTPDRFSDEPSSGIVRITETCVFLEPDISSQPATLLVWPETMTEWLGPTEAIRFTGAPGAVLVTDGSSVRLGGQGSPGQGDFDWVAAPDDSCPTERHFEVGEVTLL